MATSQEAGRQEVSFTIQTIECVACTPVFKRKLGKVSGVLEVKELSMTNKVVVDYDSNQLDRDTLVQEVKRISIGAGFGDKIIVHR